MVASASPNFVPAPTSNPNYGGSTQTALVGSKRNAALQAMPLVNGPAPAFEQFAILPEIGPFLAERPEGNFMREPAAPGGNYPVSYTHLRAHETRHDLVCRLLLEKKKYTSPSPRDKRQSRMPSSA